MAVTETTRTIKPRLNAIVDDIERRGPVSVPGTMLLERPYVLPMRGNESGGKPAPSH